MDYDIQDLMNTSARKVMTGARMANIVDGETPADAGRPRSVESRDNDSSGGACSEDGTDPESCGGGGGGSSVASSVRSRASGRSRQRPTQPAKAAGAQHAPSGAFKSVLAVKHELLFKINRLQKRGGVASRSMSTSDSVEELRCESDRMQRELEMESSLKLQRNLTVTFASTVEFINDEWNVAGINLSGWSDTVKSEVNSYDEIFEELHEKYGTRSKMPPEIRLLFAIVSSAVMFHMSHTMFRQVPGMEEALRDEPALARKVASTIAKKARATGSAVPGMGSIFSSFLSAAPDAAAAGGADVEQMSPPESEDGGVERLFSDSGVDDGDASSASSDNGTLVLEA